MLAILLAAAVGPRFAVGDSLTQGCQKTLPTDLGTALSRSYRNWKVVDVEDLTQDDQTAWRSRYPQTCPGLTTGDFDGSKRTQFAVLLNTRNKPGSSQLVFAVKEKGGGYQFSRISLWPLFWSSAVRRLPPGQYSDFYEREKIFNLKTDVIALGTTSDKAIGYFFLGGDFDVRVCITRSV
jgi:hypothetical protein